MAPKSFKYKPHLLPMTIRMLRARGDDISMPEISNETGLSIRHLFLLQQGKCPNSAVATIERLYQYLVFRGVDPIKHSK